MTEFRLTQQVDCAGWAAKLDPAQLRDLLGALPIPTDERVLLGFNHAEDAAVYQLDERRAVVATIDVITPLVDDGALFGAIAATNAISDIAAVGGRPLAALSFLAVPKGFPSAVAIEISKGGADAALAAGAPVVGGHSVEAKDVMYGLAVIGEVHPERILRNSNLRPGDQLILTKPLGTGTLTTAAMRDRLLINEIQHAIDGMLLSNAPAVAALSKYGVRAATDITGFGLAGHAAEMAAASGVHIAIDARALPEYPKAREMLAAGIVTRGNHRNLSYAQSLGPVVGEPEPLALDPQTSGGLLVAVSPERTDALLGALRQHYPTATVIGEVEAGEGVRF